MKRLKRESEELVNEKVEMTEQDVERLKRMEWDEIQQRQVEASERTEVAALQYESPSQKPKLHTPEAEAKVWQRLTLELDRVKGFVLEAAEHKGAEQSNIKSPSQ
jgi:ketopantoate reductase